MKMNRVNTERVVSIVGCMFLLCAGICSLFLGGHPKSLIEYVAPTKIVIPCVHFICCFIALIIVFKPSYYHMASILMIESVLTILTEYENLGIFFFYAALILITVKDIFEQKRTVLVVVLSIIHFLSLLGAYPFGILRTVINIGSSAFFFTFCFWIVQLLKQQFSCYIPKNVTENKVLSKYKPGDSVSLSKFDLTDRQKAFILDNLHNNFSYKEISEKHFVSISTVKKEFSDVFKIFSVEKLEELRILLLQYQIEA